MLTSNQIKAEIEGRFGFFPPFFAPAEATPEVLENLWHQTLTAYINNPLPTLFKEKLSVYLSRYCTVPYCLVCHSCTLHPLGMEAPEILNFLERPFSTSAMNYEEQLNVLAAQPTPLITWAELDLALEESLIFCCVCMFLQLEIAERCRSEIQRFLGSTNYNHLLALLTYTKTCHMWMEAHPEVTYEADQRVQNYLNVLLSSEPGLAKFFQNYREWVKQEHQSREDQLIAEIAERKRVEEKLRQQAERERLLSMISLRIRQSLNLSDTLAIAVKEVRQLLQADRVVIYRRQENGNGTVASESVGTGWSVMEGISIPSDWFKNLDFFRQGNVRAIADNQQLETPANITEFLQCHQIRASLVVPILQGEQLIGLLSAHQCSAPRYWQEIEISLMQQLANQIAIAIQQSELFGRVQQANIMLEEQVQERTAQLQRALDLESSLKRITDKVRDSLDESQILQTVVQELGTTLNVSSCDTGMYDLNKGISIILHEYISTTPSAKGYVLPMVDLPNVHHQLLQGQYVQFCRRLPHPRWGSETTLACPIFDDQGVIGDLWLGNPSESTFDDLEVRLAQQVANQCAIAIRQARLYRAAQTQVEELEKLNQLKDDFLSTVSHELRTPVSNIKMAIQMLKVTLFQSGESREIESSLTLNPVSFQKVARYCQILQDECQKEISLINDLLDLARLDTNNAPLVLTTVDIRAWLSNVVEPFVERAKTQQQQIQVNVPYNLPLIKTDLSHLSRILNELLNNACKYTPSGEIITLVAHTTMVSLQLSVSNSGVQLSADERDRIFEKFYRIPNNDPWQHGGTGLGLALVKKLVECLGATIQVESSNCLTTFTLQLPIV